MFYLPNSFLLIILGHTIYKGGIEFLKKLTFRVSNLHVNEKEMVQN
jgi:hypothetical protein